MIKINSLIKLEALKAKPSKYELAKHSKSAKTLEELSNDSDYIVRRYVAKNTNCSAEILEKLSNDSYWYVRCGVARNPNCPVKVLEKLSNDSYYDVRKAVNEKLNSIRSA